MNGAPHIVPAQISPEFSARVLYDVPMSKHTSWHAGGTADLFFTPRDALECFWTSPIDALAIGSFLLEK